MPKTNMQAEPLGRCLQKLKLYQVYQKWRILILAARYTLLLFVALCYTTFAHAQRPEGSGPPMGTISGTVTNEAGDQVLEFATVAVHSVRDSSLVGGGITDAKGSFTLQIKPGKYYLKFNFIGQEEAIISDINIGRGSMQANLRKMALGSSNLELDELTVQGERTQMELQLDKKIYNIGKDLSNLGGSAADLLANLPSLEIDVDGNVSLRGSENVQILVDGKPSGLIGLSGSGGLQQLQGNLIESVEIITNPSARYDAEGGAGIINIILKKEKAKGFNGSFQLQTGYPANHGASVNVNYRTSWINWFVNYGVSFRRSPGAGFTNNFYNRKDTTYYIDQLNDRNREGISQNIRFGSDIYFNEKNILTLSASYRDSDSDNKTTTSYEYLDFDRSAIGSRVRIDNETEEDLNWQYTTNFVRDFNRKGQKLNLSIQYQNSNEIEISAFDDITRIIGETADDLDQRADNDNGQKRTLINADYIHPFSQSGKFESGFRYSFRNIFNDYQVESDSTKSGVYEEVNELTNDFNFDEGVLATYVMINNKVGKISWQMGTRLEHTNLETLLEATDFEDEKLNTQNYLSFFPSANLTYGFTEVTSVQISYSRRINRPRYRHLNPFVTYSDPLNIYRGNPDLKPQLTNSYELGILRNKEKSSIYYGIYHRYTEDVVQRIQTETDGITTRMPNNLATRNDIGIELNLSKEFSKQFRSTGNFNFYNSQTEGLGLSANTTTFSFRQGNYYRNSKLFNAQMSIWYRAPQQTTQGERLGMASLDVGLSKDVMKNNGTISMNVRDLLNTRKYRGETITETFTTNSQFQWRKGPTVTLSFIYRINQKKQRQRSSGNRQDGEGGGFEGEF
ncbi:MAG: TonB-dependent receptor [Cytophagales bacterium]|nr:TonB-dependent receptor [Cytophagales bacterium]